MIIFSPLLTLLQKFTTIRFCQTMPFLLQIVWWDLRTAAKEISCWLIVVCLFCILAVDNCQTVHERELFFTFSAHYFQHHVASCLTKYIFLFILGNSKISSEFCKLLIVKSAILTTIRRDRSIFVCKVAQLW